MRSILLLCLAAAVSNAAVFTVTNVNDSGPGSLRQAILDNDRATGPNSIEFSITGAPPFVIKPQGQFLPPLKGPVVVRMKAAPTPAKEPDVILDGSNLVKPRTPSACPGATFVYNAQTNQWETSGVKGEGPNVRGYYGAGLAVHDSHDVEISGIQIQHFCAGIAAVRSNGVYIHDVKIIDSQGAAGVIFTGDDGNSGSTQLSFNNRLVNSVLLDNGDGFEFTRGTHDSLLQGNTIALTQPLPEDGNAVEFAYPGDNNSLIGNTFTKYGDIAIAVNGGNHETIRDNKIINNKSIGLRSTGTNLLVLGNTIADNGGSGITVSGAGTRVFDNVVSGNGGQGIVVSSDGVTLSRNSIHGNAHLGIDFAAPAQAAGGVSKPVVLPASPVLANTSKWTADSLMLAGTLTEKPNRRYAIEIFGSRTAGDGEKYFGTASALTDARGNAAFLLPLRLDDPFEDGKSTTGFFTATATDSDGSTSKFSNALSLTKR